MPQGLYGKGRQKFLEGDAKTDWDTATHACYLQDGTAYTPSIDVDEFRSSIGTPTSTSGNLGSKSTTLGVADAADLGPTPPAFASVSDSLDQDYVIIAETGTAASAPLILILDSTTTGLPVTPNGGDINITWDSGANKIFKL